jgi:hypothetical protein
MARQDNKQQPGRDRNQLGQNEPKHAKGRGAEQERLEGQQQQQRREDQERPRGENLAGRGAQASDEDDV